MTMTSVTSLHPMYIRNTDLDYDLTERFTSTIRSKNNGGTRKTLNRLGLLLTCIRVDLFKTQEIQAYFNYRPIVRNCEVRIRRARHHSLYSSKRHHVGVIQREQHLQRRNFTYACSLLCVNYATVEVLGLGIISVQQLIVTFSACLRSR